MANQRILVVSNRFPPDIVGGYELRCASVCVELKNSGSDVAVVTNKAGGNPEYYHGIKVYRSLPYFPFNEPASSWRQKLRYLKVSGQALESFTKLVHDYEPDVIFWWNMDCLPLGLLSVSTGKVYRQYCWLEDDWPKKLRIRNARPEDLWYRYCRGEIRSGMLGKLLAILFGIPSNKSKHCMSGAEKPYHLNAIFCVSEFIRTQAVIAGLEGKKYHIIHGGVSEVPYIELAKRDTVGRDKPLKLIYAGAITPDRGLMTLIEAFIMMSPEDRQRFHLTVVGAVPETWAQPYYNSIINLAREYALGEFISFSGKLEPESLPDLYAECDLLVHTSVRGEGWPLVIVEAMLAGLDVLSSGAGGAAELCAEAGISTFSFNNAYILRQELLSKERDREALRSEGDRLRQHALEHYTLSRMLAGIKQVLSIKRQDPEAIEASHSR